MRKTLIRILFCIACLVTHVIAQPGRVASDALKEHVVVAVSPDGGQVAIARSNYDPIARNGRVELWDLKTGELRQTVTGFDGSVSYLSFYPDGQTLLTTSTEFRQSKIQSKPREISGYYVTEIKWWNSRTGEFISKITLHGPRRLETVVSPDGSTIAAISRRIDIGLSDFSRLPLAPIRRLGAKRPLRESFEIKIFDVATGAKKRQLSGSADSFIYPGALQFVPSAFSPDGKLIAVASASDVKIWDVATGKKFQTIKKFDGSPIAMTFSADSKSLAISTGEVSPVDQTTIQQSEISVWEAATGKMVRNLYGRNDYVTSLVFANNGQALLFGTLQYEVERTVGTVKVWDFDTNRLATFNVHEGQNVSSLQLLAGRAELLLQSGEEVEVRDTRTWRVKQSFVPDRDERDSRRAYRFLLSVKQVVAIGFSSDNITVSGVIPGEGVRLWDSRTGGLKPAQEIKTTSEVIARSGNGNILGEVSAKDIRLWDLATGTSRTSPRDAATQISAFALSYDGQLKAIAEGTQIKLSRAVDETGATALKGHESTVEHLTFSTDCRTLISGDESGTVKIWDVGSGQLKQSIATGNLVTAVAIDPSGQLVVTAGSDYVVSVWNASTGVLQLKLKKHENVVNALVFSPDGKTLASGGDDRVAVLWDVIAGKSKQTLKGHDLTVTSIAFSPDGQVLATGSGNASVVLWNVNNGKLDRVLR